MPQNVIKIQKKIENGKNLTQAQNFQENLQN